MLVRGLQAIFFLILGLAVILCFIHDSFAKKKATFVGHTACITCHGNDAIGNQVAVWRATPHARAFRRLRSAESIEIAKKHGIAEPDKSLQCLKCHNTGGGKYEKALGEGVGCEACHGPASDWHNYENHVSPAGDKSGYKKAVSLGMYKIIGIEGIKLREKMCKRCHTIDRPCQKVETADKKSIELPLEFISDFIYKHPVRK